MKQKWTEIGKSVTKDDLLAVEKQLKIKLPVSLKKLYLQRNGGRPELNVFLDEDENDFEVHSFLRMKHRAHRAEPTLEETFENIVLKRKLASSKFLPFARDSGSYIYCIHTDDNEVYYVDLNNGEHEKIAKSLDAFVDGLVSADEAYGDDDDDDDE